MVAAKAATAVPTRTMAATAVHQRFILLDKGTNHSREPSARASGNGGGTAQRNARYLLLENNATREQSGRPGSNWHHQLGRLRFYH